jgi:hypothetical protein
MWIRCACRRMQIALLVTSVVLLPISVFGQTPESVPSTLETQIERVRAENAALREQIRKIEEQQKELQELIRLSQPTPVDPATSSGSAGTETALPPAPPETVATPAAPPQGPAQTQNDRYQDGMVIWQTPDEAEVPFLLKFNINTQLRYLNTLSSDETFTDHLGVVRDVHRRNDITVNRAMFILGGYVFDKRLRYSFTVWTSAGAASIIVAGNIGWQFDKALTVMGGYTGVPGSRSLVDTFPFFQAIDRSMADNFFRPGFTQGAWARGEPVNGLNYLVFVGNGLNTLSISATKIDTNLLFSGSAWWEPLGRYGEPGKSGQMYDDYFSSDKIRIRIGTSVTRSREDRFSNLDQSSPENTSLYNSDGVLTFSTGAFAPGVTVDEALYKMWAIDGGIKWNGLAVNGQYFMRWLGDFVTDGPIPLASTFDHGYELTAGHFVIPKKLQIYGRGSQVFGEFGNSSEYGVGARWYFVPTERMWLNAEVTRINHAPYSGAFTPYTAGMNGWTPMLQAVLAF